LASGYLIAVLSLLSFSLAHQAERAMTSAESDSNAEIETLVKRFGGESKVVENFERGDFFPDVNHACELRGTAHGEEEVFVNDYEEMVDGKKIKFQDSFE
jgi:hypothetical protein